MKVGLRIIGYILGVVALCQLAIGVAGVTTSVVGRRLLGGGEIVLSLSVGALLLLSAATLLRATRQPPAGTAEPDM